MNNNNSIRYQQQDILHTINKMIYICVTSISYTNKFGNRALLKFCRESGDWQNWKSLHMCTKSSATKTWLISLTVNLLTGLP